MKAVPVRKLLVGALVAAVAIVVLLFVGSGFGGDEDATDLTVPRPTTTLADCPVEVAEAPEAWPLVLPPALLVTGYTVDGLTYVAEGITNDPERLLNQAIEQTLLAYDTTEPDGGAADVVIGFESVSAEGTFLMNDEDGDDCWAASFELIFVDEPTTDELFPTDQGSGLAPADQAGAGAGADGSSSAEDVSSDGADGSDPDDGSGAAAEPEELVERAGTGSITTARGTFSLRVTACDLDPPVIVADADEGRLEVSSTGLADVAVTWTYEDGVVVSGDAARAIVSSPTTGLLIADGDNGEGPETVIVEVDCSAS